MGGEIFGTSVLEHHSDKFVWCAAAHEIKLKPRKKYNEKI